MQELYFNTKTKILLSPGIKLGHYKIIRLIGEGGMGAVYETIYFGLGEPVKRAIKTVPDAVMKDSRSLKRLQKEVLIATSLSHPHIVRVYGLEQYQDIHFITMEYIEGYDFREYLDKKGGKISVEETIDILKGVAEALDYAHGLEKPIIHRDLKPQNLIYDIHSEQLKIVDFGIAAEITDSVTTLTQTKLSSAGSPRYMCYEQFMGEEPAVHMDNYSFGIIVYEALNGEPPFVRNDLSLQHKEKAVRINISWTKEIIELLNKVLSKEPENRIINISEYFNKNYNNRIINNDIENLKELYDEIVLNDYRILEDFKYNKTITKKLKVLKSSIKSSQYNKVGYIQYIYGKYYENYYGVELENSKSTEYYKRSMELGNVEGKYEYAKKMLDNIESEKIIHSMINSKYKYNIDKSFFDIQKEKEFLNSIDEVEHMLIEASQKGSSNASYYLADFFYFITKRSDVSRKKYFLISLEQAHIHTQYIYGKLAIESKYDVRYSNLNIQIDKIEGLSLLLDSAKRGHEGAINTLNNLEVKKQNKTNE